MKTGDVVMDARGRRYQVALLLGRGLWGRTYRVRRLEDGADLVMKCALGAGDFPAGTPDAGRLADACRDALGEQVRLLGQHGHAFLPRLEDSFTTPDGESVMVMGHLPGSLEQRLLAGACFGECVDILVRALRLCQQLRDGPGFHGALRATNILLTDRGEIVLSDVATPSARRVLARLLSFLDDRLQVLPPEVAEATTEPPFGPFVDTYAAGMLLWRAAVGSDASQALPRDGLDRAGLVTLKDRLHARIRQEDSNPRFHGRLADRVSAVVQRAISRKASPSPPFRFTRIDEMIPRLEEVQALVRPVVTQLGRVMLDRPATDPAFSTDGPVRFNVGVTTSVGVESHEDLACGIAIFHRSTGERLREVPCTYDVTRHPSGRFRYVFTLERLPPGVFRVRLAFAVRDSGQEPAAREEEIEVRAAPGYVPPPEEPPSAPLPLQRDPDARVDTLPGPDGALTGPGPVPRPSPAAAPPSPRPVGPAGPPVPPPPAVSRPSSGAPRAAPVVSPPTPPSKPAPAAKVPFGYAPTPPRPSPDVPTHKKRGLPEDTVEEIFPIPGPDAAPRPAPKPVSPPPPVPRPEPPPPLAVESVPAPARRPESTAGHTLVPVEPAPPPSSTAPPDQVMENRWEELPLPTPSDRSLEELPATSDDDGALPDLRPAWSRALDFVRGDAYVIFMVAAIGVIIVLIGVLVMLKR